MGDLSKDFSKYEFACNGQGCCGGVSICKPELLEALQQLRDLVGEPLHVTSGYRCAVHNKRVGGAPNSYHLHGLAADIKCNYIEPERLARYAEQVPAFRTGGIIIYDGWLHVDVRRVPYRGDMRRGSH